MARLFTYVATFHILSSNTVITNDEIFKTEKSKPPDRKFLENYIQNISISEIVSFLPAEKIVDVWKLVKDDDIRDWNLTEWLQIDAEIIKWIPSRKLLYLNYSDLDIVEFLGKIRCLSPKRLSILAYGLKRYLKSKTSFTMEQVKKFQNVFCGFPSYEFQEMSSDVFRALVQTNLFRNIRCCSKETFEILLNTAMKFETIGPPTTWSPNTTKALGFLLAGLTPAQIRAVRDKSCSLIGSSVIQAMPVDVLKEMRRGQLLTLKKEALLAWRRKTELLFHLYSKSGRRCPLGNIIILLICFVFCL